MSSDTKEIIADCARAGIDLCALIAFVAALGLWAGVATGSI